MGFKCPWPRGSHEEEHFPCGVKSIDLVDDFIHNEVPGHLVAWYIGYKFAFTIPYPPKRLKDKGAPQEDIEHSKRVWREICRNPSEFVEKRLPKSGSEARELLEKVVEMGKRRDVRIHHLSKVEACLKCPKGRLGHVRVEGQAEG